SCVASSSSASCTPSRRSRFHTKSNVASYTSSNDGVADAAGAGARIAVIEGIRRSWRWCVVATPPFPSLLENRLDPDACAAAEERSLEQVLRTRADIELKARPEHGNSSARLDARPEARAERESQRRAGLGREPGRVARAGHDDVLRLPVRPAAFHS